MQDKLQLEDTVSADRKERIIFDPDAWRKSDKSGRKTSAITSRQNFDNEKFTRKAKGDEEEKVDEEVKTKTNSPQIEFVTGTEKAAPASTATGNAQQNGVKKISEQIVKKAIAQVKVDKNVGTEEVPFDPPYTKTAADVVDKSGAHHTPGSRVRHLARQAMNKQKIKESRYNRDDAYTRDYKSSVSGMGKHQSAAYHADGGANDEGWGHEHHKPRSVMDRPHTVHINGKPWKRFDNGHQAHAAARTLQAKGRDAHAVAHFREDFNEEETTMSKTYAEFLQQLQEYNAKDGVYRHKGSYGGSYDSNDDDDDDAPKKPAAPAVKRGRGRPAGSKSGANQKVTTGKSYGGIATHSLNLPNSNR